MLKECEKEVLHCLRDTLVRRGVFIPRGKDRRKLFLKLFDVLGEKELHVWTPEEIQAQIDHSGGFISKYRPPLPRTTTFSPQSNERADLIDEQRLKIPSQAQGLSSSQISLDQSNQASSFQRLGHDSSFSETENVALKLEQDTLRKQMQGLKLEDIHENHGKGKRSTCLDPPDGFVKQLTDLGKLYMNKDAKYSGERYDILSGKLTIFRDYCRKVGLKENQFHNAFSSMLKGDALEFYYDQLVDKEFTFQKMVEIMRNHFETNEIKMEYLSHWRGTTLASIKQENPEKKMSECFNMMVVKLQRIQRGLQGSYQLNQNIRDQILNGCQGISECKMALYSPAATFEGVVAQIRNALYTEEQQPNVSDSFLIKSSDQLRGTDQNYTERKYQGNSRRSRYNDIRSSRQKKCYICNKVGSWSTSHSPAERKEAFSRFSERPYFKNRSATVAKYQSFLAEWEGVEGIEEEEEDEIDHFLLEMDRVDDIYNANSSKNKDYSNEYFLTELGPANPYKLISYLTNQSAFHTITGQDIFKGQRNNKVPQSIPRKSSSTSDTETSILPRYSATKFQGIIPDTGAAGVSTAGHPQVVALQRLDPRVRIDESRAGEHQIRFGKGGTVSLGRIEVNTPVGKITFHVVPTYTPFLFCLQDMKNLGVYLDNIQNTLVQGDKLIPIVIKFGHPWILLFHTEQSIAYFNLTEIEIKQLHRRFGHPSVSRLIELLRKAGHVVQNQVVEKLTNYCHQCQIHGKSPGRFKLRLPKEFYFNHTVIMDIVNLSGYNVLHTIDESTNYQAARFLENMTAFTVWNVFRASWIDVYLGPPDFVAHDAGTNFSSKEFHQNAKLMGIQIQEVPVESHNSIGKIERYHAPLRRAYEIICNELKGQGIRKEILLQMAVKSINDSVGPHGLIPTLLVYGAYPRMTENSAPSPSVTARAKAIEKAMMEIGKLRAERSVRGALATRNGPNTFPIMNLPLNSEVLVWRENRKWTGPYKLIAMDNNHQECVVKLPHGNRKFRSTVVKPFLREQEIDISERINTIEADEINEPVSDSSIVESNPDLEMNQENQLKTSARITRSGNRYQNHYIESFLSAKEKADLELSLELRKEGVITTPGKPFEASDREEFESLLKNGVIKLEKFDKNKHHDVRIFNSRLIREIKGKGTARLYEKSRLVIAAWEDEEKIDILTQAPILQRSSQRLITAITPSLLNFELTSQNSEQDDITISNRNIGVWLRDISQAYTQSTSKLNRMFCAKVPQQFKTLYPDDIVMVVLKPLYGIPEAGTHWWVTYMDHHKKELGMQSSTYDPCLMIAKGNFLGVIGMQTDDTLIVGDESFSELEETKLQFTAKPKQRLTIDRPLVFNGCILSLNNDHSIYMTQKNQGQKIGLVSDTSNTKFYVQQRARGAYIASICQPEACYDLSVAAQTQNPFDNDISKLNKRLGWQKDNLDRGLRNVPLDLSQAKLFVFVDASFANNEDLSSQIGFVIILANETNREDHTFAITGNIIHYSSTKCKRVTRSVLASEIYGMVGGVDMGYAIATTINLIFSQLNLSEIPIIVCTDSYSLYECIVKLGTTKEKRLMIDIMALRQSYEHRELYEIRWINGADNPADAMTKNNPNKALERFINTNILEIRMEGWVKRD